VDTTTAVAGLAEIVRQGHKEDDFLPLLGFPHRFIVYLGVSARMGTACELSAA